MLNFFNRYFSRWKTHVALKDCLTGRYSKIERQAFTDVQSNIKDFLGQCGRETLLMNIYDNPGKFNPLYASQKPIIQKSYTISELISSTSVKGELASFLLLLASRLKSKSVLELGTYLGISGMYLAGGISLNARGVLHTVDRSNNSLKYAKIALKPWQDKVKIINGEFRNIFQDIFPECGKIGLAFIDGDHHKGAMTQYFDLLLPAINAGGVIVFDDINWSSYTTQEWKQISVDKRVFFSKGCGRFGFVVIK